ncbi:kinase D-interacting substrate of 220 kDa [Aplysia californica]|uniref:Kinase D-interacting substrate of 220 kDa n=1 Tax=Aplysia californica TaxID=6500 RepID=A0ABM0JIJ9_APLCA|nr:kinase D-interacting substrate of 220 kDa [Aplysia californica]
MFFWRGTSTATKITMSGKSQQDLPYISQMLHTLISEDNAEALRNALQRFQSGSRQRFESQLSDLLCLAAAEDATKCIECLLSFGASVNGFDARGDTALLRASSKGCVRAVKLLISAGAGVNLQRCTDGTTPLNVAAMSGHTEVVRCLLDAGAEVDIPDDLDLTPLQLAAIGGFEKIVRILLSRGANVNYSSHSFSDKEGRFGISALMFAARAGSLDLVRCLMGSGALLEQKDSLRYTALTWAAQEGQMQVVKHLLRYGADVNVKSHDQNTPLILATKSGQAEMVKLLLQNKAERDHVNVDGDTALMVATKSDQLDVLRVLTEDGAHVNVAHDKTGWTPLFYSCSGLQLQMTELLLDCGADVNFIDARGENPLWITVKKGNTGISRLLLSYGSSLIMNNDGETALFWSTKQRDGDLVRLLLESGATIDLELHEAVVSGTLQVVRELVAHGGMPVCVDAKRLDSNYYVDSGLKLSPFMVSLLRGKLVLTKYFIHIKFLLPEDLEFAKCLNRRQEAKFLSTPETISKEILSFLIPLLHRPWTLGALAFIALSSSLGFDEKRRSKIESLAVDPSYKRQLMFEDDIVKFYSEDMYSSQI